MFKESISTINELPACAAKLLNSFGDKRVFLLHGQMGAGKTTFIKEICKLLGVMDSMSSPTYSIVNEYKGAQPTIYHFDLYRIKDITECLDIGFEEYVNSNNYCFIEWPEIAMPLVPLDYVNVTISTNGEIRTIEAETNK